MTRYSYAQPDANEKNSKSPSVQAGGDFLLYNMPVQDDKSPEEGSKGIDPSSANDSRDEEEVQRADAEFKKASSELGSLNVGEIESLLTTIDHATDKYDQKKILQLMWQLDQSGVMVGLRNWWDRRSSFLQKCFYYNPSVVAGGPLFKMLVTLGFLDLKGSSSADISKDMNTSIYVRKWGLRIASWFIPELRPFMPLVEVCEKLSKKGVKLAEVSRTYLESKRDEDAKIETSHIHRRQAA